jgi:glycine cleavage system transcriptional repressor
MKKMIISVLGKDRPGIIAAVTKILFEQNCNIENVSQTILQSEFSGIFIVGVPRSLSDTALHQKLEEGLVPLGLHVYEKAISENGEPTSPIESEPFVITTKGPDRKGLVAAITGIMAKYNVNVTNLQAVFKGGDNPNANIMIYEVDIPRDIDQKALRRELRETALSLKLDISIQHKLIFETINRV